VFAGLGATPLGARFASAAGQRAAAVLEPASEPRLEFWRVATVAFAARPWLGSGLDSFQFAYQRHQGARAFEHGPDSSPGHAHNEVLQVAATQGSVGVAALALVAVALVAVGSRAFRGSGAETRAALAAPFAGLAALAVQGLFSFTVTALGALLATWLGVVSSASRAGAGTLREEGASPRALGATLAACAALAASLLLLNGLAVGGGGLAWLGAAAMALPLLAVALAAWRVESATGATHPRRATGERRSPSEASARRAALAGAGVATCAAFALKLSVVDPFWTDALERRGLVLLEETSPSAALPYLAEAARREPEREAFWRQVGVARHRAAFEAGVGQEARRAHLESAAGAHARARDLVPANPLNHANLARALADLARASPAEATREAAREAFARALSLAPLHARVLEDAAKAELFFGDPAQAERLAKRSLRGHPRHAAAWALVAAAAMERRDFAAAEAALRSAAAGDWRGDRAGEAAGWANLATVLLALERPQEATEAAERALAIDPRSEPAQRARARVRGENAGNASGRGAAAKAQ
jgi:tetratricopeptide (TPR) repeat protein